MSEEEKSGIEKRRDSFSWKSKQELYEYFEGKYGLKRDDIDKEIDEVTSCFRLRKGRPIITQELWEKVGINLKEKHERLK